jgi:hypothetical protein
VKCSDHFDQTCELGDGLLQTQGTSQMLAKKILFSLGILASLPVYSAPYDTAIAISRCTSQMTMLAMFTPDKMAQEAILERTNGWKVAAIMELVLDGWDNAKAWTIVESEISTSQKTLMIDLKSQLTGTTLVQKQKQFTEYSNYIMGKVTDCLSHNDRVELLIRKMRESQK